MEEKFKIPSPPIVIEPEILFESFWGDRWYKSEKEFLEDCIQMKDGRWRRKRFWERGK